MLRITTQNNEGTASMKLEGKLVGAWVDEAEHAWHKIVEGLSREPVLVDLCGVTFIDAEGKKLLRWMCQEGAVFASCGPDITAAVEQAKREAMDKVASRIPQI